MRLLVVTNLFFPDRGGGAAVFSDMCFGLREIGWEVTVFTTHPYYPEWRRKSTASPWRIQTENICGVQVHRHGLFVPNEPSRLSSRILYELSFGFSLMRSLFRGPKFDAVMVYCPMLGAVMFSALRHALLGEPLWLNVQDIPADAAEASGISKSRVFNSFANRLQKVMFNSASVWSTISPVMRNRLLELRTRDQEIHLCPNWLNGSMAECVTNLPLKVGRAIGKPLRLLYAGNIGKKQGLLDFCRVLYGCRVDFRFRIHGNGGEASTVKSWVSESKDSRFVFGEFLDEVGFTQALHETDLFVITEKSGSGASFIPSKLIPGISTGTPIFAICDRSGPLGMEMTQAGLGQLMEWNEIHQIDARLHDLVQFPEVFVVWQQNCIRHSTEYKRENAIDKIGGLLKGMVEKKR